MKLVKVVTDMTGLQITQFTVSKGMTLPTDAINGMKFGSIRADLSITVDMDPGTEFGANVKSAVTLLDAQLSDIINDDIAQLKKKT